MFLRMACSRALVKKKLFQTSRDYLNWGNSGGLPTLLMRYPIGEVVDDERRADRRSPMNLPKTPP